MSEVYSSLTELDFHKKQNKAKNPEHMRGKKLLEKWIS